MHPKSAIQVALGLALLGAVLTAFDYESGITTYYDGRALTVEVRPLDPRAVQVAIARKPLLYRIYDCDGCEPDGQAYVAVVDAITAGDQDALWREIQIEFNPGFPCQQFTSDEQIAQAVEAGAISLSATHQLYRCEVLNPVE